MYTSPQEVQALQRVAELEAPLQALELSLGGLAEALRADDPSAIETRASDLHRALAQAVGHFSRAARQGGVPPVLRQRLAVASARVAAQREALARATASLDRAIDMLLPDHPLHGVYGAGGAAERTLRSGPVQA
ncbi:MAG: hypothetical protein RJA10_213 [Pseudomonadota bacterium]|jgi:hypothetical protein